MDWRMENEMGNGNGKWATVRKIEIKLHFTVCLKIKIREKIKEKRNFSSPFECLTL